MKKIKSTKKKVEFSAFDYTVHIVLTEDVLAYAKRRWKGVPFRPAQALHVVPKGTDSSWLLLPYNPTAGEIAHEAWHAVRRMLDDCEAELENEVVAYHLGYLVNVAYSFVVNTREKEEKSGKANNSGSAGA
jgi:hypothetical protein